MRHRGKGKEKKKKARKKPQTQATAKLTPAENVSRFFPGSVKCTVSMQQYLQTLETSPDANLNCCLSICPRCCHPKLYIFLMLVNEEQHLLWPCPAPHGHHVCELCGNLLQKTWLQMSNVS